MGTTLRAALIQLHPSVDSTANAQIADVIGNKEDAAVEDVGTDKSLMSYTKGILEESEVIDNHLHRPAQWFGRDSIDGYLNRDSVSPWTLTAGTSQAYGAELQISDGTEIESGDANKLFDFHEMLIVDNTALNAVTTFKIEIWVGLTTFAAATLLTECVATFYAATDNHGVIIINCPRTACNNKIWTRAKCSVNSKQISFIIGLHTYDS